MILIISENDQIIGADEEFLEDKGLDYIKENFPSMSIFLLQNENGTFNFTYNEKEYSVTKLPIIMDSANANLYCFETPNTMQTQPTQEEQSIIETKKDNNDDLISVIHNDSLNNLPSIEKETSNLDLNLNTFNEDNSNNQELNFPTEENKEVELDLGIETPAEENKEVELDLGIETPSEKPKEVELDLGIETPSEKPKEVELDLGIGTPSEKPKEVELDLGIETPTEESKEVELDLGIETPTEESKEVELDLGIETPTEENKEVELDLGIETPTEEPKEVELDLGIEAPSEENKEVELDLGIDISEDNIISISKEEIESDLQQASQELGIDNTTIQEFFKDFKQQVLDEKEIFFKAIENKDYETLHKSSHKLKGVALNLRLNKFAELLKNSDNLAKEKADITKIKKIIENIYSVIEDNEDTQEASITIETNLEQNEKNILLKAVLNFLEEIKTKDLEAIKEEILNAYNIVPIKEFKEVENINSLNEITHFIKILKENIKKEIK